MSKLAARQHPRDRQSATYTINLPRSRIEIANPLPGGSCWTSRKRAESFVRRGLAMMVDGVLVFYGPTQAFRQRFQTAEFERSVAEGRGARLYWNGSVGAKKMKRPGEVVC